MSFFSILTMIGGIALFLYGINLMGEGLSKASGGRLESILEKLTNKPIKAVLVGAGVTAVIQSSAATTVMVVGFVNSGIMRLEQAANVIKALFFCTGTCHCWRCAGVLFEKGQEKGRRLHYGGLWYSDDWYGYHERGGKPAGENPGIWQGAHHVFQSHLRNAGWSDIDGGHSKFLCIDWYPAGVVQNRFRQRSHGNTRHHGAEYRLLHYRHYFQRGSEQGSETCCDAASVLQHIENFPFYGGILYGRFVPSLCVYG